MVPELRERLDTTDLQAHHAPSAKDHTRQPTQPNARGDGPPAPHQAAALKKASLDGYEYHSRSPRASQDLSNKELQLLHDLDGDDEEGEEGEARGAGGQDDGDIGEEDDGMEDDMMDKISSSPSIDDGGYPLSWPARDDSLSANAPSSPPEPHTSPVAEFPMSQQNTITDPLYFPSSQKEQNQSFGNHHLGGYYQDTGQEVRSLEYHEDLDFDATAVCEDDTSLTRFAEHADDPYDDFLDETELENLLVPPDDPIWENDFDDIVAALDISHGSDGSGSEMEDTDNSDNSDDDDDDGLDDVSYNDSRFVDSGWGGECLRDVEDIDFEFVYALHTFVATVEGQANAKKGDTMVLLDDSNSYWWLVKVVHDSSIGMICDVVFILFAHR